MYDCDAGEWNKLFDTLNDKTAPVIRCATVYMNLRKKTAVCICDAPQRAEKGNVSTR